MPAGKPAAEHTSDRVSLQLEKDTAKQLDSIAEELGRQAGEALGMVVPVTRTAVVRALVTAKVKEMQAAGETTEDAAA